MHLLQSHGTFLQFPVVFLLSVHFLWNIVLHLLHDNSWSLGWEAVGLIRALQCPQVNVEESLMLEFSVLIVSLLVVACALTSGSI